MSTVQPEIQPVTASTPARGGLPSVTSQEKHLAAGMHIASIFFPILAPAITFVLAGKSRFVRSHSYQAIFETLVLKASVFIVGAISLTMTIITLWHHYQNNDWQNFSWTAAIVKFLVGWILFAILEIFNTIVSVMQAARALGGTWPKRETKRASKENANLPSAS